MWAFSALSGLPGLNRAKTLNIEQMSIKSYAIALLPSLLPCSIIRTRGHRLQVIAMYYWNLSNLNLSLETVNAFLHRLTSIDRQAGMQNRSLGGSMKNCWLASLSIRIGLFKFVSWGKKKNILVSCVGEVKPSCWWCFHTLCYYSVTK